MLIGWWAVQVGLGIVLVSVPFSSCGLGSLFGASWVPLEVVFGCSWSHVGPSWELLGSFLGTPDGILKSYNPIGCSPINWSIHQSFNLQLVSCLQVGPADCAKRLNKDCSVSVHGVTGFQNLIPLGNFSLDVRL